MNFLKRVVRAIGDDNLTLVSAGVAFYLFLSLFPMVFAGVSIYGLVADPATVQEQMDRVSGILPNQAQDVIEKQMDDIASEESSGLGWGAALAILVALWSAGKGSRALIRGLNIAYNEHEDRHFVKVYGISLLITVSFLAFLALSLFLIAAAPALIRALPLGYAAVIGAEVGKWVLLLFLVLTALAVIYRYAPSKYPPQWRWVTPGAVTASVLWLAASALFAWFAASFGNFNETYGVLAGGVVLLLWLQISTFVILLGAEINDELEK